MMEEKRFKVLYEQTAKPLLAYLVRVTGEKATADDVFQEAYVRMLQSALDEPSDAKLRSYLFTTATNLVRDRWRRSKRDVPWESEGIGDLSSTHKEDTMSLRHSLESALDRLSAQHRSLLWLAYVEGYEHREIAAMLNVREKSVRVLLFRARQRLLHLLKAMGIGKED